MGVKDELMKIVKTSSGIKKIYNKVGSGLLKFVGAFSAAMGGVDLIVFTGGIGENDPKTRAYIGEKCAYLGVDFDNEVNNGLRGKTAILTKKGSKVKVAVVCTNEELVIATDTMKLVKM